MVTQLNNLRPPGNTNFEYMHFISGRLIAAQGVLSITVGSIPANGVLVPSFSSILVTQAFNAGATNTVSIGYAGSPNAFANAVNVGTVGFKTLNGTETFREVESAVVATFAQSGTPATSGEAQIILCYANYKPQAVEIGRGSAPAPIPGVMTGFTVVTSASQTVGVPFNVNGTAVEGFGKMVPGIAG